MADVTSETSGAFGRRARVGTASTGSLRTVDGHDPHIVRSGRTTTLGGIFVKRTPLKRGKGLKSDPAKTQAWQRRSAKPLPFKSEKRIAENEGHDDIREAVFKRDGYRCALYGVLSHQCTGTALTPHHLLKDGRGGAYTTGNLLTLCAGANTAVEDNPYLAMELGLVVGFDRVLGVHVDHAEAARRRRSHGMPR